MDILFMGKVSLDDIENIKHLKKMGLAPRIAHKSRSFDKKDNTNSTLDFILNNLK